MPGDKISSFPLGRPAIEISRRPCECRLMQLRILHGAERKAGASLTHSGCMQQRLWSERLPAENRSALQLAQSYGIGQMPSYNTRSDEPRSTPFYRRTTHPAQHFWALSSSHLRM